MDWEETGIDRDAFLRYVEDRIYSLPGIDNHREVFSIFLTGSRATGTFSASSDVDIHVVCPRPVYEAIRHASMEAGTIRAPKSFFVTGADKSCEQYFGSDKGWPHFSLVSLNEVEKHFREYLDVWLWVWTNAKVVTDPGGQFREIRQAFHGYPRDVLVRKVKRHWLLAGYWALDAFPAHPKNAPGELLAAATAVVNSVNEYLRFFFLVEGNPFPYTEKLMEFAVSTRLGERFVPLLERSVDLAVGKGAEGKDPWTRLENASDLLVADETVQNEALELEKGCQEAMVEAGVDPAWVEADFKNIDELLLGRLGPAPE